MGKVVAICGATASGKTALAIALAKQFNGEVVSADSRLVYRGMDIGTAKPPRDTGTSASLYICEGIRHHLIDMCDPDQGYTLSEYKKDACAAIDDILSRGKTPFLAGGTGLYMDSVLYNMTLPDAPADNEFRARVEKRIEQEGLDAVFMDLCESDPEAARIVDGKNPRRVIRALEIARATGEPFSHSRKRGPQKYDLLKIGINVPREILQERIDTRVDEMIRNGFENEVRSLVARYGKECPAFDAIGYAQLQGVLEGKIRLSDAVADIKKKTAAYAKRQMTWFKKDTATHWIDNIAQASLFVNSFLT